MKSLIAQKMRMASGAIGTSKSELDKFLVEENEDGNIEYDILECFASKSAFSTSGRVLGDFRSSLTTFMVQCLVSTQDWLRQFTPVSVEGDPEDLAKIEEVLLAEQVGNSSKSKSNSESITKPSDSTS